jgi:menaquinone-9 beta-reductase
MKHCDVAIIGGGVAGCSAAIHLARRGVNAVLFESKTYPHHKVCGEFLSPECGDLLNDLGVMPDVLVHRPPALDTIRFVTPGGVEWTTRLEEDALGLSRYALDDLLMRQARDLGVEVHEHTTVQNIQKTNGKPFLLDVHTHSGDSDCVEAQVVIAAHGKRSRVDTALNRSFLRRSQPFVGLKAHFRGPHTGTRIDLFTFPGGYCGMSAVEGGVVNVCLLVQQDVFHRAGGVNEFVAWMASQNPLLGEWLAQAEMLYPRWLSISQVTFAPKNPVEGGLLMAGDSAALIAPLAGNGMAMALRSGEMAARYAAELLSGTQTLDAYAHEWRAAFGERLRLAGFLQAVLLRPALLEPGLRLLNTIPALGSYFVHHTREYTAHSRLETQ